MLLPYMKKKMYIDNKKNVIVIETRVLLRE